MANTKSSQKDIRKIKSRTLHNRQIKTRLKTLQKKVLTAFETKNTDALATDSKEFVSALDKAGKSGLVHQNKINRLKSRCSTMANETAAV